MPPEEVDELRYDVTHRDILHAKEQLHHYLLIAVPWTILATLNAITTGTRTNRPFISYFLLPLLLGIIPAIQTAWTLRRIRTRDIAQESAFARIQELRYEEWLGRHRAPLTVSFIAALLFVGLAQIYLSTLHLFTNFLDQDEQRTWSAIEAAGLVKRAVWDGEIWRLFTSSMLHGSIWHFIFNVAALYVFGKVVEVLVGRVYLPIVFFFSALTGDLFSLLLVPATSVGSSGGIMGIIGFLALFGYYNRVNLPPDFLRSILGTIGYVALLGVVAFVLIDNAAHAGGTLCGVLLGYLLLPHHSSPLPLKSNRVLNALAVLCSLGMLASVLGSIVAMITWR
jgi:membrane associated rhomboid family serine protease